MRRQFTGRNITSHWLLFWVVFAGFNLSTSLPSQAQNMSHADSLLLQRIHDQLAQDSRMPVQGITIAVYRGLIRLKGIVPTLAQKEWAAQIVYGVPGVKAVDNKIWVDRIRISDKKLRDIVWQQLKQTSDTLFSRVEVKAQDGKIILRGRVNSWGARQTAREVISLVPGVQKIDIRLKIRDDKNRTDEQIKKAVELALRKKIQMNREFKIKVSVVRGVVTLKGRVRTLAEKKNAIQTTLFVPGVAELVDHLEVLPE